MPPAHSGARSATQPLRRRAVSPQPRPMSAAADARRGASRQNPSRLPRGLRAEVRDTGAGERSGRLNLLSTRNLLRLQAGATGSYPKLAICNTADDQTYRLRRTDRRGPGGARRGDGVRHRDRRMDTPRTMGRRRQRAGLLHGSHRPAADVGGVAGQGAAGLPGVPLRHRRADGDREQRVRRTGSCPARSCAS